MAIRIEEVATLAQDIKPADIIPWTAEQLSQLPKEAKFPGYSGRWSKNVIEKCLEERYAKTNNPGSVKMSCCNLLRAAIKRCEVQDGSDDQA